MKKENATKKLCRLQIQKQMELNSNDNMDEMYLHVLEEKEIIEHFTHIRKYGDFTNSQLVKIIKVIRYVKDNGWFEKFQYKNHNCAVSLDEHGKWRIYVQPLKNEFLPFQADNFEFDYMTSSSRFGLKGFNLGLWWYGDKIGLDDFIGVNILSHYSWKDYFENKGKKSRGRLWNVDTYKIYGKCQMKNICKKLVDCLINYQSYYKEHRIWECDLCGMQFSEKNSQGRLEHVEYHNQDNPNVLKGEISWRMIVKDE
jgi:hypothetical protein